MSGSRTPFIYIVLLTLLPVTGFAWSSVAATGTEVGLFWTSLLTALAAALYAWRHGERIGQVSMLLVYYLLACSVTLAVTSLVDLANFSFLGKHKDAESGLLLGGLLAFCLLAIISVRLSRRFPAALAWGALVAFFMLWVCGSSCITGFSTDHSMIITMASIIGCIAAFTALCRSKVNLTDSQYLGVLSLIVISVSIVSPGSAENLTASLLSSLVHLLAGILFFSVRRDVSIVVRIAAVMWIYLGFTSIIQDVLLKVLNVNDIAAGIPSLFCSMLVMAWSRFHKDDLPRNLSKNR